MGRLYEIMRNIEELDGCFRQLSSRLPEALPDGIEQVNLETLRSLNLLAHHATSQSFPSQQVPWHYFHVHDSGDKITLHNDRYIAWIIPEQEMEEPSTLVIIASEGEADIHPELAFRTQGVYNSSRTVLRVLERYLDDIEENNSCLKKFTDSNIQ